MVRRYIIVGLYYWVSGVCRIVCVCVVGYLMGRYIGRYVVVSMGSWDDIGLIEYVGRSGVVG